MNLNRLLSSNSRELWKTTFLDFGKPTLNYHTWTISDIKPFKYQSQLIGVGGNLQETIVLPMEYGSFLQQVPLHQSIDRGNHFRFLGSAAPVSELR